jgi:transposase
MLKSLATTVYNQQIHETIYTHDQLLIAENKLLKEQIKELKQAYDFLQTQVDALKRMIFGSKSERFIDPESKQPSLLDEQDFSDVEATGVQIPEKLIQVAPHSRKKKVNPHKSLPRRKVIITLTEAEMLCECGTCKDVIRTEVKEIINYVPAVFELIEQHRQVAVCPKCKEGIVTAPAPLQILPKVGVSESFLSYLVVSKFQDRQPLYHLESKMYSYGVDCSRQNMARWLIDLVEPLRPIYNLLKDNIIEYDVASCDATSLQVLKEPGRSAQIKSDVYCMSGGPPNKSVVLYDYNANKHKEFVSNWFTGFKGYLHVDADNSFDLIATSGAVLSCCNAHARRKFEPIAKATKGHGIAKQALIYYSKLYKIEREAKDSKLSYEQRYVLRQEKSKPLMEELYAWLDKVQPTVLPQSTLGKAVAYAMNHRVELMRFLDDGRLEIDNNHTERMIKPLVIARKNFMFCNSVAGANAVCMHFGLIQTAKLHGLDPYEYYVILLTNIPYCKTVEDYELLLPWSIKAKLSESTAK